jgi:hypothetical protein
VTTLLSELGKKLADRWLTSLVLPGLLFVAATVSGLLLGHGHALDGTRLTGEIERRTTGMKPVAVIVLIIAVLLASTAAGLLTQAVAGAVRRVWTARRPKRFITWRARRSAASLERYRPARLTPVGDRFRLADERVDVQFGLSIGLAWPRIWLLLNDSTATAVTTANTRYRAATETTAWGVLYLALGTIWWPAALAGAAAIIAGYRQGRVRGAVLADLVEATVDIHQKQLADAVGIDLPHGRLTPAEGLRINDILNKRA